MKIIIRPLECGGLGSIIDCYNPGILCPFCKERHVGFPIEREVTPQELYNIIDQSRYIIKIKKKHESRRERQNLCLTRYD